MCALITFLFLAMTLVATTTGQDPCAGGSSAQSSIGDITVFCKKGYLIIQDRPACSAETISFNQDLAAYAKGFGKVGQGYWLGLDALAKITAKYNFQLVVGVRDANDKLTKVAYDSFTIGSAADGYPISVSAQGYQVNGFPKAADFLNQIQASSNAKTNGQKFAVACGSGWWYQDCKGDNLNGACSRPTSDTVTSLRSASGATGLQGTRLKIKYLSAK